MNKISKALFLPFMFFSLLMFAAVSASAALSPQEARSESLGSTVTVMGYAASAHCGDGTGFENEFYLSNRSSGICVAVSDSDIVALYQNLEVTGVLNGVNGEIKIIAQNITPLSSAGSRMFKQLTAEEAENYDLWGGTYARLIGTASNMKTADGVISSFTLTDEKDNSIKVIIESCVLSSKYGLDGKKELTQTLEYKREVVVDGFVASINGETVIRIKDCDDIDVKYHICKFGEAVTEKEPTCNVAGLSVRTCSCGKREETILPASEHNFKTSETKATCTNTGLSVRYCVNCDFKEETVIPKKNHSYKERTEISATCTAEGLSVRYCSTCDFREETVIPKKNHSYKERTEASATCTVDGLSVRYCSTCDFREETVIPKKNHSYKECTEKKASCTEEGIFVRYCSNCDFREETAIAKTEHRYKETTEKKASCSEDGVKTKTCTVCNVQEKTSIPKLSHSYETVTEKATFNRDGSISRKCRSCGETNSNTVIPAISECKLSSHTFTYNGKKQTPYAIVTDKNGNSISDFTVTSDEAAEIGKYKLTVELCGDYEGKKTFNFSIVPENVSDLKAAVVGKKATVAFAETQNADGYRIYYETGSSLKSLGTTAKNTCSVTLPDYGKSYTLVIKSYKKTDDGTLWSSGVKAKISTGPEDVTGIKTASNYYSVTLTWDKTDSADGYRVYLKNSSGKYEILTTTTKTSFTKVGLSGSSKYSFAVKPYRKADGKTLWGSATKKTASTLSAKAATFSAKESYYNVALSWRSIKDADGYRVYKYDSKKKKYLKLKTVTDNSFTAENLNSGTTYRFAVKPYAKYGGKTYWGEAVYLTVTTKLKRPTLSAVSKGSKGNYLSWKKVNGADGYEVYYCYEKDGKYKKLKTTDKLSLLNTKASKTKSCYYKVRAYKTVDSKKLYSSFSTVKKVSR